MIVVGLEVIVARVAIHTAIVGRDVIEALARHHRPTDKGDTVQDVEELTDRRELILRAI